MSPENEIGEFRKAPVVLPGEAWVACEREAEPKISIRLSELSHDSFTQTKLSVPKMQLNSINI